MMHAFYHSVVFQKACKNHHVLKQFSFTESSTLRKLFADFYQHYSDDYLVHKIIKSKVPWVARGVLCESTMAIINIITVEGYFLYDI